MVKKHRCFGVLLAGFVPDAPHPKSRRLSSSKYSIYMLHFPCQEPPKKGKGKNCSHMSGQTSATALGPQCSLPLDQDKGSHVNGSCVKLLAGCRSRTRDTLLALDLVT